MSVQADPAHWTTVVDHPDAVVEVRDMASLASGGAMAVGALVAEGEPTAAWIARLSDRGDVLWTRVFDARVSGMLSDFGIESVTGYGFDAVAIGEADRVFVAAAPELGGEFSGRMGAILAFLPNGDLINFQIRGNGAEQATAIDVGRDGVIVGGESHVSGFPEAWMMWLADASGETSQAVIAEGGGGRMRDLAYRADGRLQVVLDLMRDNAWQTYLLDLPPSGARGMGWENANLVEIETADDRPAPILVTTGPERMLVFRVPPAPQDDATAVHGYVSGQTLEPLFTMVQDDAAVIVTDADGGPKGAIAVGSITRSGSNPALWVGAVTEAGATLADGLIFDVSPPDHIAVARAGDGGALVAATLADGTLAIVGFDDVAAATATPAPEPVRLTLDSISDYHDVCSPVLCSVELRLPQDPRVYFPGYNPLISLSANQSAEAGGLAFSDDGTLVAAIQQDRSNALGLAEAAVVSAIGPDGTIAWSTVLPADERAPLVHDVAVLSDGSAIAVGLAPGRVLPNRDNPANAAARAWRLGPDGALLGTVDVAAWSSARNVNQTLNGLFAVAALGDQAIAVGASVDPPDGLEFGQGLVAAIAADGSIVWQRALPGDDSLDDSLILSGVASAPDGSFVVSGFTPYDGPDDEMLAFVARLDRDGNVLWQKAEIVLDSNRSAIRAVSVAADGGIVVTGSVGRPCVPFDGETSYNEWVGMLSPDGDWLWQSCITDRVLHSVHAVLADGDRVLVGGTANERGPNDVDQYAWIGAFDASDGSFLADAVSGTGLSTDAVYALAAGPDGAPWFAGQLTTFRGQEAWFGRLAPDALAP